MIAHRGHITPVWVEEHVHFPYTKQPIKDSEIDVWTSSSSASYAVFVIFEP